MTKQSQPRRYETRAEREFETGKDESYFAVIQNGLTRSQDHYDELKQVSVQALQNAVTVANQIAMSNADTSNLVNKQAVAHRDVAINHTWTSVDELQHGVHGTTARVLNAQDQIAVKVAEAMVPLIAKAIADVVKEISE